MTRAKRLALFKRGAKAVETLFNESGFYICPICGNRFNHRAAEVGELTLEHVPPEALGGKPIALTCRTCNNTAGHTVDSAMHSREKVAEFTRFIVSREPGNLGRAIITVGDDDVNVEVSRDLSGTTTFRILAESNDPAAINRVRDHMDRLAGIETADGEKFGVQSRVSYHPRLAKIGDLRSGFLAAFAALGYRYALSSPLVTVRNQILLSEDEVIPSTWIIKINGIKGPAMVLSEALDMLVVNTGGAATVLPWITSSPTFYEEIAPRYVRAESVSIRGHLLKWPTGLRMDLDFTGINNRSDG